jgi:regulation of enolase protein 1 (concanavalin A-like superfamily)
MQVVERFLGTGIPEGWSWFNAPARFKVGAGLELWTDAETDFWQRTHYGFRRDDGHCLLRRMEENFCLTTCVEYRPETQYDQCGLMVRVDAENWIKVSTEYEGEAPARLGSVVTNLGYSDWATQDVPSSHRAMWYRVSRSGMDFLLEHSYDGEQWQQLRVTHLHRGDGAVSAGVYACSPIGADFWCRFRTLEISESEWTYEGG